MSPESNRPPRRRRFKVQELPPELIAEVTRLIDGGQTYSDITSHLSALGHAISRSAVGRFGLHYTQRRARLEETAALARELNSLSGLEDLELCAASLALDMLIQRLTEHAEIESDSEPITLGELTRLLSAVARVQTASVQRDRWRDLARSRAQEAAKTVEGQMRNGGLPDDTVNAIRRQILGIVDGAESEADA